MSFILDALKKSENERQQNAPAEFSIVPTSLQSARPPRWLWVLGGLLVINVAIVGMSLFSRAPQAPPQAQPGAPLPAPADTAAPETVAFKDRLDQARLALPERPSMDRDALDNNRAATDAVAASVPGPGDRAGNSVPEQSPNFALLPSLSELRANGTLQLPDLHVDIHVFSATPSDRFVFINMNKYREDDQLGEGPLVREITRDGVVLDHDGTAFVLLRD